MANEVTGRVNNQYNKIEDYFHLKEENKRLNKVNDSLMSLLPLAYAHHDTTTQSVQDVKPLDSTGFYRRYFLYPAEVTYSTVSAQKNYIQLNRGSNQGIQDGWGVIGSDGSVVGTIVNVSPNFSQVMSLLHVDNRLDASLKKSGDLGTILWDGKNPNYLTMIRVPKAAAVAEGDSVITSGNNDITFPKGFLVGTVSKITLDNAQGMYQLQIKPAANLYNLQQVHIINNIDRLEQQHLMEETKNKVEQTKQSKH
ncbi:MAG: rod shape-determining protein MreC [Bacteroidetes bacterium]|nr:rod shape-determining protein MreC [Bacteroidota bacterium]